MLKVRKHDGKPVSVLKKSALKEPQAVRRTWEKAWLDAHGHKPPEWSKKELGQARHLIRWWGSGDPERFHAFLYDAVVRWKEFTRGARKAPPPLPVLGWLLAGAAP